MGRAAERRPLGWLLASGWLTESTGLEVDPLVVLVVSGPVLLDVHRSAQPLELVRHVQAAHGHTGVGYFQALGLGRIPPPYSEFRIPSPCKGPGGLGKLGTKKIFHTYRLKKIGFRKRPQPPPP